MTNGARSRPCLHGHDRASEDIEGRSPSSQSVDIAYTDTLEFYSSVREAAKRRVDAAETLFNTLSPFFKSMGKKHEGEETQPTKKEELRNAKGLIRGTHDGILVIENKKLKLVGGKQRIIDETFKDTAEFKEIEDGKITE